MMKASETRNMLARCETIREALVHERDILDHSIYEDEAELDFAQSLTDMIVRFELATQEFGTAKSLKGDRQI